MSQIMIDQIVRQQEEIMSLRRELDKKVGNKQHVPASRSFWAVSVHSKSGIAHLVTQDLHKSCCGLYFAPYVLRSAGSSGIGAPRCKRCMASKEKDNAGI